VVSLQIPAIRGTPTPDFWRFTPLWMLTKQLSFPESQNFSAEEPVLGLAFLSGHSGKRLLAFLDRNSQQKLDPTRKARLGNLRLGQ